MVNSIREETSKLLHNRMIVVVLFIIPIAANLLIGGVFQSSLIRHIPMAVVDHDQSGLSRTIIQQFAENETFSIKYILQDEEKLEEMIQDGTIKTGMIIPGNFSSDVTNLKSPNVLMIYDGSSMPVASSAKSKASEILMTLKTGAAMKLIGGKLAVPPDVAQKTALTISFKNRFIYNPARSYSYTLNPGLGTAAVQSAIVLMGAVCINKEKLREGLKKCMGYIAGKVVFYGVLGTASLMCSVFIQNVVFDIPMKSNISSVLLLSLLMALAESACAVMISVWVHEKMFASMVAAVLFIPSTAIGGYTWPRLSMPPLYQFLSYIMPFAHYGDPLRNLYLKGISLSRLVPEFKWFIAYIAVCFILAAVGVMAWNLPVFRKNAVYAKGENTNEVC